MSRHLNSCQKPGVLSSRRRFIFSKLLAKLATCSATLVGAEKPEPRFNPSTWLLRQSLEPTWYCSRVKVLIQRASRDLVNLLAQASIESSVNLRQGFSDQGWCRRGCSRNVKRVSSTTCTLQCGRPRSSSHRISSFSCKSCRNTTHRVLT
jgi:hypothetical protein